MLTDFPIFASELKNKYQNYYRMKKLIIAALLLAFPLVAGAQNRVEVSYESPDSIPAVSQDLMNFLDITYMKVTVHGDIKGKKWILWSNDANDGKVTPKPVFPYTFEFPDTTATFTFVAQKVGEDSVKVSCITPRYSGKKNYAIASGEGIPYGIPYILMETLSEKPYGNTDEINLAAYASGVQKDEKSGSYSFCDLRYAKTDPKEWQEKHQVPRFVYFSLRME